MGFLKLRSFCRGYSTDGFWGEMISKVLFCRKLEDLQFQLEEEVMAREAGNDNNQSDQIVEAKSKSVLLFNELLICFQYDSVEKYFD